MLNHRSQQFFQSLQNEICLNLEAADGKEYFLEDIWKHHEEGGGTTRVLQQGAMFEKAGVNFSAITSKLTGKLADALAVLPQRIFASGISVIIHPESPMIPAGHMNLRYLELEDENAWFGGGIDLTPYYIFEEDARLFHSTLKRICDKHDVAFYPRFKQKCDEYFYLKHRNEARGIGGIFFDYLQQDLEKIFLFVQDVGKCFTDLYLAIAKKRKGEPWGGKEKEWQLIRRGRYVEFNLIYDRGTLFGLETQGRTESILVSLPPQVKWEYDVHPEPGSREKLLLDILQQPRDWTGS
ncbi:MAG: oxygen-dependent coproporphyrinogen oxidase [Bacteroidetes bacterium]|nr:MAG: oxygen-dependent coproporphyrinogen oxidase [Bacteroidota bacterium]